MHDVEHFGLIVLVAAVAGGLAVLSNRISERTRVPAPALFLVAAAVASEIWPQLYNESTQTVQRIVTVCLVIILFDGGMHIGVRRFRSAAGAVALTGIAGTLLTAGAMAVLAHLVCGLDWRSAALLGTAIAPTDPAVVFSVLGRREVSGRAGTILEGESGANDPVGIALMLSIVAATGGGLHVAASASVEFLIQMAVGLAVGVLGGYALRSLMRRFALPNAGLYPLRTIITALMIYGIAATAHGSGFLAVFVAGIIVGDARAPYKREIEQFTASLASLAEILAFAVLGVTLHIDTLLNDSALWIGLFIAVVLAFVVRPLLVGPLLAAVRLTNGERTFILWSGLKGAVPILLGTFVLTSDIANTRQVYDAIFVVVAFSVIVQGSLVPTVAHWCRVPMRQVAPQPWAVGVRLQDEPTGLRHYRIVRGALADGRPIDDLPLGEDVWISLVTREDRLVAIRGDTVLHAGDEVLAVTDPQQEQSFDHVFCEPAAESASETSGTGAEPGTGRDG